MKSPAIELHPVSVNPRVWYLVRMDLIGPFHETCEGFKYVITMTDYFSKYVEAIPIQDKSAIAVARGIFKIYCRQGAPVHVVCDQGKELINKVYNSIVEANLSF